MSATPEQIAIDEKALEAAERALANVGNPAFSRNGESPYRIKARAAITAYLSATKDAQAERVRVLEGALRGLVDDVADYPAWQRPCHALDVARAALRGEA